MRLINTKTLEVRKIVEELDLPAYAILSHTWGDEEELSFQDLSSRESVRNACRQAAGQGIQYLWTDACCVDRSSSAELSEAINSMFKWYNQATICYAYLHDLSADSRALDENQWKRSRWFNRIWALQELIASTKLEFFDAEWQYCGSKSSPNIVCIIQGITGIPARVLLSPGALGRIPIAERMSWATRRYASREEDVAYSLLGIFGIQMPIEYGEGGEKAFMRLQEHILGRGVQDGSLFAWRSADKRKYPQRGLLAKSPSEFAHFARLPLRGWQQHWGFDGEVHLNGQTLFANTRLSRSGNRLLMEIADFGEGDSHCSRIGVCLEERNGTYYRADPDLLFIIPLAGKRQNVRIMGGLLQTWKSSGESNQGRVLERFPTVLQCERTRLSFCKCISEPMDQLSGWDVVSVGTGDEGDIGECFDNGLKTPSLSGREDTGGNEKHKISGGYDLSSRHALHSSLSGLTRVAVEKFCEWKLAVMYITSPSPLHRSSPRHWTPPCNRYVTGDHTSVLTKYLAEQVTDDKEIVCLSSFGRFRHFGCPFYIFDSNQYRKCLSTSHLYGISDLVEHLRKDHPEPPYCPVCYDTFDSLSIRDQHICGRTCRRTKKRGGVGGVSREQLKYIIERNNPHLDEESQWFHIFSIIFPDTKLHRTPYLVEGVELEMSLVRDFWSENGRRIVWDYLARNNCGDLQAHFESTDLTALQALVLQSLVGIVMDEQYPDPLGLISGVVSEWASWEDSDKEML